MWVLTLRSPSSEPREYLPQPGKTTLGRKPENTIVIPDESASRLHAEIDYQAETNTLTLHDLGSTNGTFVNRERCIGWRTLRPEDQIRIGQHVLKVTFHDPPNASSPPPTLPATRPLTRDLLLESVDQHALLLYEVANRLNTLLDLDIALREVARLLRVALGADRGEVILAERFDRLGELGFPTSIARQAITQHLAVVIADLSAQTDYPLSPSAQLLRIHAVLCVPVMAGDDVVALTYVYKTDPLARPFDQNDLQLAVVISHQVALTIQRTRLLRQAEAALRNSEERYRAIIQDQTELICRY